MSRERVSRTVIATMAGRAEYRVREHWVQTLMLVESLRRFGGPHAGDRVLVMVPDAEARRAPDIESRVAALGAEVVPFRVDEKALAWDPAAKAIAAAAAEERAPEDRELVWADSDTLVLKDLRSVELDPGIDVGYRPVYGVNIGSRFEEPLDPFWSLVYEVCGVSPSAAFAMTPCTANVKLRPYVNLGLVVVRPAARILREWSERCARLLNDPRAERFAKDDRYEPFLHQAVLSAVITGRSGRSCELPAVLNYGLEEHEGYPEADRARCLNELVTCRYSYPFEVVPWPKMVPAEPPLDAWLEEKTEVLAPLLDPQRLAAWRAALAKSEAGT